MAKRITEAQRQVYEALDGHLRRRDTNEGKSYCCHCGENERRGKIRHSDQCVVTVAVAALDDGER